MLWSNAGSSEAYYLQEVLCCPLSLIPTIYGLRLMDNIELGPTALRSIRTKSVSESRHPWKRSLSFLGVQLSFSPTLDQWLKCLRAKCFSTTMPSSCPTKVTGTESYSPLTFHYVLSDLINRGSITSALMAPFFLGIPPVFRKSVEANDAWTQQRPVWRVKVVIPFTFAEQSLYDRMYALGTPMLRLVLVPTGDFMSISLGNRATSVFDRFLNSNSTDHHIVDNIEVYLKLKSCGLIDQVEISFLLEDRSLLQTHCGIVMEQANNIPVFLIGSFSGSERQVKVDTFREPYPWKYSSSSSPNAPGNNQLIAESCLESQGVYSIRLKVQTEDKKALSGLKVTTDQLWPCESAHRITVSLDGITSLTLTLPYPILPDNLKATLRRKDAIVEIMANKALQELWPEDCAHNQLRWNPDDLELWHWPDETLGVHLGSQFNLDYLMNSTGKEKDALCQVREIIRTIFVRATQGKVLFQLQFKGSNETTVDWFIRAHPPIRISRQGAPMLLLSAIDHHKAEQLTDQGKLDRRQSFEEFQRIFSLPEPNEILTIFLYSAEEVRLIRYVLRLNSTKIRPSLWQKKNLPLKEPSPWLATFIRPLYRDG